MEWNQETGTTAGNASTYEGSANQNANASGNAIDDAKEKARQAASDAQQKVTDELKTRADDTKARAADTLGSVAEALSQSAQQLRSDNHPAPGEYVERAQREIRRASDYLRNTSTDEMVRNAEDFARRQPALFIGGAFMVGLLAARVLKSSQQSYAGGTIPHNRSLVPESSTWRGDREASVSGFREPGMQSTGTAGEADTDLSYTRQFGRESL